MKKYILLIFLTILFLLVYNFRETITSFAISLMRENSIPTLEYKNEFYKDDEYNYVELINDFNIKDKKQLLNAYYTIINSGINEFSFYCNNKYEECINDVITLADNQKLLSVLNGFVHPFNSFSSIETIYDNYGKVTVKINKSYTEEQIIQINQKVDEIIEKEIKPTMDNKEKIKAIHDYIINNATYDKDKSDKNITKYNSSTAYGALLEGYAICGGYTDAMEIFLDRFDIPSFEVISENHIWNAVYLNNKWYHLDLTWDDPISVEGFNILDYNFFLISTKELKELNTSQHNFDKTIFTELAN